jgi:hypothetical protein
MFCVKNLLITYLSLMLRLKNSSGHPHAKNMRYCQAMIKHSEIFLYKYHAEAFSTCQKSWMFHHHCQPSTLKYKYYARFEIVCLNKHRRCFVNHWKFDKYGIPYTSLMCKCKPYDVYSLLWCKLRNIKYLILCIQNVKSSIFLAWLGKKEVIQ